MTADWVNTMRLCQQPRIGLSGLTETNPMVAFRDVVSIPRRQHRTQMGVWVEKIHEVPPTLSENPTLRLAAST